MRPYALPCAGAAGLTLLFALLTLPGGGRGPAAGSPAPPFELADLSGRTATLSEYRGKVVLIDFWATWCADCVEEMPGLKLLHTKFSPHGFELLAASIDEAGPSVVAEFAAEHKLPYRVLFAQPKTAHDYGVIGLPTKVLIDRRGLVFRRYMLDVKPADIENDIRALLEKAS